MRLAAFALTMALPGAAAAQDADPTIDEAAPPEDGGGVGAIRLQLKAASDERVRGLSWSGGRAAASAGVLVPVGAGFEASATLTTLRGSERHGGADVGMRIAGAWSAETGGWRLGLGATGYLFPGHGGLDYAEVEARAGYSLGPASLRASARYAPRQAAIGGDNLHLALDADLGVPGTRWTLFGGVGHSLGAVSDPLRAARLRPAGAYWNWSLGAERVQGPVVLGAEWTDTTIAEPAPLSPFSDRHVGSRFTVYLRLDL